MGGEHQVFFLFSGDAFVEKSEIGGALCLGRRLFSPWVVYSFIRYTFLFSFTTETKNAKLISRVFVLRLNGDVPFEYVSDEPFQRGDRKRFLVDRQTATSPTPQTPG